jgi:hypothetical protein
MSRDGILYRDLIGNQAVMRIEWQNSVSNNLTQRPAHFLIGVITL